MDENINIDRIVQVTESEDIYAKEYSLEFDSSKYRDSEALHILLCEIQPGDKYTIEFKNLEN
jgi:hypothetical protein